MSLLKSLADNDEITHYEEALARYLDLELDAERFTALRLQQGVYGQRQEGVNMVRIKLPGGRLDPARLAAIAEIAERHVPQQVAHITTRQDIQLHHVPLAETGAVLRRLHQAECIGQKMVVLTYIKSDRAGRILYGIRRQKARLPGSDGVVIPAAHEIGFPAHNGFAAPCIGHGDDLTDIGIGRKDGHAVLRGAIAPLI